MKRILAVCIVLTCIIAIPVPAEDALDENIAKSLIVRQFLAEVKSQPKSGAVQLAEYRLCTFRDSMQAAIFEQHLTPLNVSVNQQPLKIRNIQKLNELSRCNALYLNEVSQLVKRHIEKVTLQSKVLIIVQGRGRADAGAHIGLFLNRQNTFNYELNLDAFLESWFVPSEELINYANVVESQSLLKAQRLRQLINFTEWPELSNFNKSQFFNLCLTGNKVLAQIIQKSVGDKSFKNKPLRVFQKSSPESLADCHGLVINRINGNSILSMINSRLNRNTLVLGFGDLVGESGVHFNLIDDRKVSKRKFEINLMAFEKSGHKPRFELLNSADLVKTDYLELSSILLEILRQTQWPATLTESAKTTKNLCISKEFKDSDSFEAIFNRLKLTLQEQKLIGVNEISHTVSLQQYQFDKPVESCDAMIVNSVEQVNNIDILSHSNDINLLLITNLEEIDNAQFHFNVSFKSKRLHLDIDIPALSRSGFVASRELLKMGTAFKREAK
ncbi:YfiR family protein [Aliikangiella sp. IMCC44653]